MYIYLSAFFFLPLRHLSNVSKSRHPVLPPTLAFLCGNCNPYGIGSFKNRAALMDARTSCADVQKQVDLFWGRKKSVFPIVDDEIEKSLLAGERNVLSAGQTIGLAQRVVCVGVRERIIHYKLVVHRHTREKE